MEDRFELLRASRRVILATAAAAGLSACAADRLDGSGEPPPCGALPTLPVDGASTYAPGQLLVRFKSGTAQSLALAAHAQRQAQLVRGYRLPSDLQLVELPEGVSVEHAIARYREDPNVLYVQPNFRYRIHDGIPDDERFSDLWGMHSAGQLDSLVDADIDAPEAWEITTGSRDVILGVLDTGIEYDHEDLFENVFSNPGEIPDNGQDDDGNGFADDIHGINALERHGDPRDDNGHGTHVSGTIAGRGDNGVGVAGVNWDAQIVSCKAFDARGYGSEAAILTCMDYFLSLKTRADHPVDIIATNNSWGGGPFSQALLDAIETHRQAGMLFVAAAGNNAGNNDLEPTYPASYDVDNVIAVAATDQHDDLAYFSNYGARQVDIGAPGSDILSTVPWGYDVFSGTSMAAPHVTGVIGLLAASDPSLGPDELRNLLLAGGDEVPGTRGTTLSGRRINAFGSLTCADRVFVNRFAPAADQVSMPLGASLALGVLSIDCARPHPTAQSVTVRETGEIIHLVDASGNGQFEASFQPPGLGAFTLEFPEGDVITVNVVLNYEQARIIDFEYRDIKGTKLPLDYAHEVAQLEAPFPIRFGNAEHGYEAITVGSNGALSFTESTIDASSMLPSRDFQTVVAPLWMELEPGLGGGVSYAVLGSAPDRELVIEWDDVPTWWAGSGGVSFQVVFFENRPEMLFSYADVHFENHPSPDGGAEASVGVQVSSGIARQFSLYEPGLEDGMTLLWSTDAPRVGCW